MSAGGEKTYVLAIDNGTQSVRALLFDESGHLLGKGKQTIEPYFSDQPGWAEQDPEYYWQSLHEACNKLWSDTEIPPSAIKGVTLTTQRGSVVCVDQSGKALRPAIIWLDQRMADVSRGLGGFWDLAFKVARVEDSVRHFRRKAQANWLAQHEPETWRDTHKFLLLSGYLTHRLTGCFTDSVGAQVGYIPFDYKRLRWAKDRDWKWRALSIAPHQLPDLVQPGGILGTVTVAAAKHIGIPAGLPLFASASDKACEILGSGGVSPEVGCMSYGTTATINSTGGKYIETIPYMPPYPAAIPGQYCSEVMIYRGFWLVSWFKKEFSLREERIARRRGIEPEALFEEMIRDIPPGSMGLTLQPFWSPGVREPGPEAKGAIIGFGDVHTRAHIYRAILEGLAYALRDGKERIEKRSGVRFNKLRVSGGGSQSDIALQLTADIFNLPVERPHTYETSGLGAAMDAMVGLGVHPDFATAIEKMTRVGKRFEPRPEVSRIYNRLYTEVYQRMYKQLRPLYQSIRDIVGYPK